MIVAVANHEGHHALTPLGVVDAGDGDVENALERGEDARGPRARVFLPRC